VIVVLLVILALLGLWVFTVAAASPRTVDRPLVIEPTRRALV
jgi:hypothetical protein